MRFTAALLMLAATAPLAAQRTVPAGWNWRTDVPASAVDLPDKVMDTAFTFVPMPPGWHVTMGPGGVLYPTRYFAETSFTLESQMYHFPNSSNGEYGLVVGGRDLAGETPRYVVFAVRGNGEVAAWEQIGGRTRMLADWTRQEAVIPNPGNDVVGNILKLSVDPREAVFRANGLDILVLPLDGLDLSGGVGYRIGKGVNLHSTTFNLTSRLAPVRGS